VSAGARRGAPDGPRAPWSACPSGYAVRSGVAGSRTERLARWERSGPLGLSRQLAPWSLAFQPLWPGPSPGMVLERTNDDFCGLHLRATVAVRLYSRLMAVVVRALATELGRGDP
jgi:hypothetical protein